MWATRCGCALPTRRVRSRAPSDPASEPSQGPGAVGGVEVVSGLRVRYGGALKECAPRNASHAFDAEFGLGEHRLHAPDIRSPVIRRIAAATRAREELHQ